MSRFVLQVRGAGCSSSAAPLTTSAWCDAMADLDLSGLPRRRKDALETGSKYYFTGKPCKRGHVAHRWACDGKCWDCEVEFRENNRALIGTRHKAWRLANPDKWRAITQRNYANNKDKRKATTRAWVLANPEKKKAIAKRHYAKHAARYRAATRRWRAANMEYAREACREWNRKNPVATRVYQARRRALKDASGENFTTAEVLALVLKQGRRCAGCGELLRGKWAADHIQPLSKGGGNSIRNIQILCVPCNQRKHAKDPLDWARENGRLL